MKEITKFWNWFLDNEEAIQNALVYGINTEEVFNHLDRNFYYISKRIGYSFLWKATNKSTLVFTAGGYPKLFPKIAALEDQAPSLKYFKVQAFIKPISDFEQYITGNDNAFVFENYKIKISKLYMSLIDYDICSKQLKIKVYLPNYEVLKINSEIELDLIFIVMNIIGEIAYRKHIKSLEIEQLTETTDGMIKLYILPQYIEKLYDVNSRLKPLDV